MTSRTLRAQDVAKFFVLIQQESIIDAESERLIVDERDSATGTRTKNTAAKPWGMLLRVRSLSPLMLIKYCTWVWYFAAIPTT